MKTRFSAIPLIIVILFLSSCSAGQVIVPTLTPAPTSTSPLRYDGLYQSVEAEQGYFEYLRFYDDGTVLEVVSSGTPEQVAVWLNKAGTDEGMGYYEIQDSTIKFTVTYTQGAVDYTGTINGEKLILDIYSHINSHKGTRTFQFVEVPNIQP